MNTISINLTGETFTPAASLLTITLLSKGNIPGRFVTIRLTDDVNIVLPGFNNDCANNVALLVQKLSVVHAELLAQLRAEDDEKERIREGVARALGVPEEQFKEERREADDERFREVANFAAAQQGQTIRDDRYAEAAALADAPAPPEEEPRLSLVVELPAPVTPSEGIGGTVHPMDAEMPDDPTGHGRF